jgi:hypothetical protein
MDVGDKWGTKGTRGTRGTKLGYWGTRGTTEKWGTRGTKGTIGHQGTRGTIGMFDFIMKTELVVTDVLAAWHVVGVSELPVFLSI